MTIFIETMVDEPSIGAIEAASVLYENPELNGVWHNGYGATWGEKMGDGEHDCITVFEILGVDVCSGDQRCSLHGKSAVTISIAELEEMFEKLSSDQESSNHPAQAD